MEFEMCLLTLAEMTTIELILITKENPFATILSKIVQEMKEKPARTSSKLIKNSFFNNQVLLIDEDAIADQPENNLSSLRTLFPFSLQILFVEGTQKRDLQNYLDWGCNSLVMKNEPKNKMKKAVFETYEIGFYLNDYLKTKLNLTKEEIKTLESARGKLPQEMN